MQANRSRRFAIAMAAALVAACGSPTSSSAPGSAQPSTGPGATSAPGASSATGLPIAFQHVFDIPSDPIAVTPTLDDARAVEQVVPIEGGTLSASGADGTTFVLTIPGDALATETTIRMTPVASIDGMPFGADPHAVQMEPSGLQFVNYVTLTITPSTEIPVDQQILFGYDGTGANLTLALPADRSPAIAIKLLHFSGAGVTAGTAAQVTAAVPRIGASAEARITSAIAAELGRARQAAILGGADAVPDYEAISNFLDQYFEEVVKPRVAAASQSCAAGVLAMQTYLGYHRQLALLGAGDRDDMSDMPDLAKTVEEVCVREEYQRCHDNHVVQNMIPTWLGASRQMALLGVPDDDPAWEKLASYARKCLVFDLTFESEVDVSEGGRGWNTAVRSNFELRFNTDTLRFDAVQAELVNFLFKFNVTAKGCTITSTPGGGLYNSIYFMFLRGTRTPTDEVGYVRDIEYAYNPGATHESVKIQCPKVPTTTIPNAGFWSGTFIGLHRGEFTTNDYGMGEASGAFEATDWEVFGNGQAYFAKKEWIKSGNQMTEAGTLKLYHTPE